MHPESPASPDLRPIDERPRCRAPRVLVTAGPTREPIDAVRFLSNRSSGRMGVALALAAAARGWPTTLAHGPLAATVAASFESPTASGSSLSRAPFESTADLEQLLRRHWPSHDILLMAAAVSDHRPVVSPADLRTKRRRLDGPFSLELEPTPDLLAQLVALTRPDQLVIAFALEPAEGLIDSARAKLRRKGAAAIVANPLETMDGETIDGSLILASAVLPNTDLSGTVLRASDVLSPGGPLPKAEFAEWLLDRVGELHAQRRGGTGRTYDADR